MKTSLALLAVVPMLAACTGPFTVDVRHARTDAGYINSGLVEAGRLLVMDTTPGHETITEIGDIELTEVKLGTPIKSFKATNLAGAEIEGTLTPQKIGDVKAQISHNGFIELTDAQSATYSGTYTALSRDINSRTSDGEDVGESWRLAEAVKPGSPLRYVLAYSVFNAESARFGYDNTAEAGGSLVFDKAEAAKLGITVKGADSQDFAHAPVLLKYYVLKASLEPKEGEVTYHFARDFAFDMTRLPAILRKSQ